MGNGSLSVPLLQFVDDASSCESTMKNILSLKSMLRCFEVVSGLKVNFHKSRITGIALPLAKIQRDAMVLNCQIMEVPFIYLGMSVEGN